MNPITDVKEALEAIHQLRDDVEFLKDIVRAVLQVVAAHESKKSSPT